MILCHTPLKNLVPQYQDKYVLVSGIGSIIDVAFDYGKFSIVINEESLPYLEECTLDWTKEGLNEYFKIINPKEISSCGCGVSIGFDPLP